MAASVFNAKCNCTTGPKGFQPAAKKQQRLVVVALLDGPKVVRGFRYRRSTLTRAPRKRTFIANMQKYIIDEQDRTVPAWGAAVLPLSNCSTMIACCIGTGTADAFDETVSTLAVDDGSNGGSNGGRMRFVCRGDDGDDAERELLLRFLPPYLVAAVVALSASLFPVVAPSSSLRPGSSAADPMVACSAICAGFLISLVHYSFCFARIT